MRRALLFKEQSHYITARYIHDFPFSWIQRTATLTEQVVPTDSSYRRQLSMIRVGAFFLPSSSYNLFL